MKRTHLAVLLAIALGASSCGDPAPAAPPLEVAPSDTVGPETVTPETVTPETVTPEAVTPEPQEGEGAPEAPVDDGVDMENGMAGLFFEASFDIAAKSKIGDDAWNGLIAEYKTLYAAEMQKSDDDAFEQPFEDAIAALQKKYGVGEPE